MITQYAYAKQIPGGYEITSIRYGSYVLSELPKKCKKTGLPILFVPEAVDKIKKIHERTRQKLELFLRDIRKTVLEFVKNTEEDQRNYSSVPESDFHETEALSSIFASCCLSMVVADEFVKWHNLSKSQTREFERVMNGIAIDAARRSGHQVVVNEKQDSPLLDLLESIIPDCGDPNCEIHGDKNSQQFQSVTVTEEEDDETVQVGHELGGEA